MKNKKIWNLHENVNKNFKSSWKLWKHEIFIKIMKKNKFLWKILIIWNPHENYENI